MTGNKRNPFLVGVHDLIHRPGEMREQTLSVALPETLGEGLVSVAAGDELHIDLQFESIHEGILVTADAFADATGVCGRCLRDVTLPIEVDFQELFAYSSGEAFDYEVHDDHVDLEPLVRDAVVLALPFQPVCQPDCPGLDPETGQRLDDRAEQTPRETPDPRWSALAAFTAKETAAFEPVAGEADSHDTDPQQRDRHDREEK